TFGLDGHSHAQNAVFASPISLSPSGFALKAGTPGSASSSSPGSTTGTASGSACDMGAWGGASPPGQIGCNFGPVPEAPVIISVSLFCASPGKRPCQGVMNLSPPVSYHAESLKENQSIARRKPWGLATIAGTLT